MMYPLSIEVGEGENPVELGATTVPKSNGRAGRSEIQAVRATRLSWQKGENQGFPPSPFDNVPTDHILKLKLVKIQ